MRVGACVITDGKHAVDDDARGECEEQPDGAQEQAAGGCGGGSHLVKREK